MAIQETYEIYEQISDYSRLGKNVLDVLFDSESYAENKPIIEQLRDMFAVFEIATGSTIFPRKVRSYYPFLTQTRREHHDL